MSTDIEVVRGSGNVWRDLGYADADIRRAKGALAARIIRALNNHGWSTREAARRTGFAAADFSRIRNADYGRFTLDRMIRILGALNARAEVRVSVRSRKGDAVIS